MISKLKKYKNIIIDLFINTFSFSIYIIAQQILFMPIMGKLISEDALAKFIMYISIFSIISNSLGSELGIVRQIREEKKEYGTYNKTLFYLIFFVFIISTITILFLHYSIIDTLFLSFIVVLANIRLYACSIYRMNKEFKKVFVQNILYLIGIVIGLLLFKKFRIIWIPSLVAEMFSLLYSINTSDIKKMFSFKEDRLKKDILLSFKDYSIIEFLINMLTYFDKILIYPILGTYSVNVYYATSTMSKVVSLITNPLHGVILSWIKSDDKNSKNKIISHCLKYCAPFIIIITIFCVPITYFAVRILYNKYLNDSLFLIIPISFGVGFTFASTIIKAILLKYIESKKLLKTYLIYLISFIIMSIVFSKLFSLIGFAIATMISKIILLIMFIVLLKNTIIKGDELYEN